MLDHPREPLIIWAKTYRRLHYLSFQREGGAIVDFHSLKIEPGSLVTHNSLLNSVRLPKPDQGMSALKQYYVEISF